jgi:aryl-alcohol dehydrogenase-like predicted oxidoreductase
MKYRFLGKTGIKVSEIGFGAWGIGGVTKGATSYGPTDDGESKKALLTAFENGIIFFDTSDLYGYGHSEELIGEALGSVRDKIVIASKAGFLEHKGQNDISRKHLTEALEGSLKRLRTDYVDLYQLHSPTIELLKNNPDTMETLKDLQGAGKIRSFGLSVKNPEDGLPAINNFNFPVIQANFNMLDQRIVENGLVALAEKENVGIIARTPLCFGFLTNKISDIKFDLRDHRSTWSPEQLTRWAEAPDLFSFLNRGKPRTPAQLALKFCLSFKSISTAIPGILKSSEAEENAAAADLDSLSEEELEAIQAVYKSHEFFYKALKPKGIYPAKGK